MFFFVIICVLYVYITVTNMVRVMNISLVACQWEAFTQILLLLDNFHHAVHCGGILEHKGTYQME